MVTKVFHLGFHYLLQCDFPVYVNLTLKFLCTLEVKLFKVLDESSVEGTKLRTTSTLSFQMNCSDFEIPVETLGDIIHLPTDGEAMSPNPLVQMNFGSKLLVRPHKLWRAPRPLAFTIHFLGTSIKFLSILYFPDEITQGLLPLESYISSTPW